MGRHVCEHAKERASNGAAGWGRGTWNLFERARPRISTTRLAPARRLWRGGGHVGVVGAAKLGSDLEATNRAVGVSGSAHTKAALARGRDAVVEGDRSVVEADVEERRLLGVHDGGLAEHGLRRRRLVQEAVGGRQEQGSYEIGLRFRTVSVSPQRRAGGFAPMVGERTAVPKRAAGGRGSSRRRVHGVGSGISSRKQPKQPGLQGPLLTASGAHVGGSASRQQWCRA